MAMNAMNRGGLLQTRPGSVSLFTMPDGNVQGCTFFKPSNGLPYLVFAVDGKVYASPYPFRTYSQVRDIQFSKTSRFIAWAPCIQSTYYTPTGDLKNLDIPKAVLMMQDGNTRAAYWDGAHGGHLNPTHSNQESTPEGMDETPVGLWMVWSNNRLWVSCKNQIFASDIGNPLKFTETQYLNEARSFYLTGDCTGMVETSDRQGIIAFTLDNGVFFQTSIQDRTQWLQTAGFQQTILPSVGCCSPRSIVPQYGLIWWYTPKGLINQNDALRLNITSRLDIQDNEMYQSKFNLSYDLSGVCGGFIENFLFHGVPNGDKLNTRVHVLDQAPFEEQNIPNSWCGYWTGWRPVEFARGVISSTERVFCCSVDYDGVNRMWEMFRPEKTDNGVPITSWVLTRQHFFNSRDWKKFRFAEIEVRNLLGDTAMMVALGGLRGGFQTVMQKDMTAQLGQVYADGLYGYGGELIAGSKSQIRVIRTVDGASPTDCNSSCIETDKIGAIDKGFSLLIAWSGICGVSAYRIFTQYDPEAYQGICEDDETGETRLLNEDGCGSRSRFGTTDAMVTYTATATFSRLNPNTNLPVTRTVSQTSIINQEDADRKAAAMAEWYVLTEIGEVIG